MSHQRGVGRDAGGREPVASAPSQARLAMIDCDVHNNLPGVEALFPYLPEHWVERIKGSSFKGVTDSSYPKSAPTTARPGSAPPDGGLPGSDLATLQAQLLEPLGVERAILNCTYAVDSLHN